jgi:V/A-type H+-transporting ATPase subunit K
MNKNTLKTSLRTLLVLATLALIAQGAAAAENTTTDSAATDGMTGDVGVGLALGLAAIGAGFSQAAIGSAAVGMLAEDGSKFGVALIFTALPESIVILGALPLFLQ